MEYVARLNIERYEKLLRDETDDKKRSVLQVLLDKERSNLIRLSNRLPETAGAARLDRR